MSDAIVVLNAGSSSLKFSLYRVEAGRLDRVVKGLIEGIGTNPHFTAKDGQGQRIADESPKAAGGKFGQAEAFSMLHDWLERHQQGATRIIGVGHRVVHGGAEFIEPTRVDADVLARLEKLVPLAPLHQPHNLAAITSVMRMRPELPQVACFDTAFHRGRSRDAEQFGLPDEMFGKGVRRWGFHGLSYESIAQQFRQIAPQQAAGRVIAAHLGNGASLCAMRGGRCVDTTMGFSTLDGVPMGTRCGGLDPGVMLYLLREGWNADRIEDLLYKKSGLLGISGLSNDVRALLASDAPRAKDAIDYYVFRIVREIGALVASLGGLDALIFTAGVGENSAVIRGRVCVGLGWLGVRVDAQANERNDRCISPRGDAPSVWVIPTDEEGVIAGHTLAVIRREGE
jgi:acetate kinase